MKDAENGEDIQHDVQDEFPQGDEQGLEEELRSQEDSGNEEGEEEKGVEASKEESSETGEDDLSQYARRTQKRMRQLLADRKKESDLRKRLERERDQLRERMKKMEEKEQELRGEFVKSGSEAIRARLQKAIEEGDDALQTQLMDELIDLKMQRRESGRRDDDAPEAEAKPQEQEQPPAARWVEKNRYWFQHEPDRLELAKQIEAELVQEGYSRDDDDLYDELDARLDQPRRKPQRETRGNMPTANASRRDASPSENRGQKHLSREDLAMMTKFGLDKDNPKHREEWLTQRRQMA